MFARLSPSLPSTPLAAGRRLRASLAAAASLLSLILLRLRRRPALALRRGSAARACRRFLPSLILRIRRSSSPFCNPRRYLPCTPCTPLPRRRSALLGGPSAGTRCRGEGGPPRLCLPPPPPSVCACAQHDWAVILAREPSSVRHVLARARHASHVLGVVWFLSDGGGALARIANCLQTARTCTSPCFAPPAIEGAVDGW